MATKLYLVDVASDWQTGNNDTNLRGTPSNWVNRLLRTTAGSGSNTNQMGTVAGPTAGLEVTFGGGSNCHAWISPPLNADVTISGSITWNIWGRESSNSANVAIQGQIERVDGATGTITLIDRTARTTEMAVHASTNSVSNFSETPASGVACKRGDRLRVRIFGDDTSSNMGTGFTFNVDWDGSTGAANGDTWVQVTENLTFVSEPAGSQVFLTDTASAVSTASQDREAWTSRGAGVQSDATNTVAGWTAPIQITDTAAGTVVDWFTKPLEAFTLGGAVRCNMRASTTGGVTPTLRVEVAVVANDGTSPTVWGATTDSVPITTSEAVYSFLVGGEDLSVSQDQRLRIRWYIDDRQDGAMGTGRVITTYYAGTSGGASGDTYLTFGQTLTEFVSGPTYVPPRRDFQQMLAH
jgi:hypothetical protein